MTDKYAIVNAECCLRPKLQLIWEPSLGYEPFVCCLRCNNHTYFTEEEE